MNKKGKKSKVTKKQVKKILGFECNRKNLTILGVIVLIILTYIFITFRLVSSSNKKYNSYKIEYTDNLIPQTKYTIFVDDNYEMTVISKEVCKDNCESEASKLFSVKFTDKNKKRLADFIKRLAIDENHRIEINGLDNLSEEDKYLINSIISNNESLLNDNKN